MVKQKKKNKKKKDLRKKETNGDLNFQRRVFNQIYHVSLKVRAYNDSDLAIQRLYTNISEIQASICLESRLETYQRGCRFVLPEFRITLFVEGFYAPRFWSLRPFYHYRTCIDFIQRFTHYFGSACHPK